MTFDGHRNSKTKETFGDYAHGNMDDVRGRLVVCIQKHVLKLYVNVFVAIRLLLLHREFRELLNNYHDVFYLNHRTFFFLKKKKKLSI